MLVSEGAPQPAPPQLGVAACYIPSVEQRFCSAMPANAPETVFGPRPQWVGARRIVVKIGSSLLVDRESGQLKAAWLG